MVCAHTITNLPSSICVPHKANMLQTQVLSVGQVNEPCIGLTQENSIENSVQDCLPLYTKTP